jgi:hypothetical protein
MRPPSAVSRLRSKAVLRPHPLELCPPLHELRSHFSPTCHGGDKLEKEEIYDVNGG